MKTPETKISSDNFHFANGASVSKATKSSAQMSAATMNIYSKDGNRKTGKRTRNQAFIYHAPLLSECDTNGLEKQSPESWVLDRFASEAKRVGKKDETKYPEYSLPIRFADVSWSSNASLGAIKLLHLVFASVAHMRMRSVTLKKKALTGFLAKSKASLSTSLMKENLNRLSSLSATVGVTRMVRGAGEPSTFKIFDDISSDKFAVTFILSDGAWNEFQDPKLYANVGLNSIQKFNSLGSLLLFTVFLADHFVKEAQKTRHVKGVRAHNKRERLKAAAAGYDFMDSKEIRNWDANTLEFKLHPLAEWINLKEDDVTRQDKRIQKRVLDAVSGLMRAFEGDPVGPGIFVLPEYCEATLKQRKNVTTKTGRMKFLFKAPVRPAEYVNSPREVMKAFILRANGNMYVSPTAFRNALAVAGFDIDDPEMAVVIHNDWKRYLYENKDVYTAGMKADDVFPEYARQLAARSHIEPFEDYGLAHAVGKHWADMNGKLIDAEVYKATPSATPEVTKEDGSPEEPIVLVAELQIQTFEDELDPADSPVQFYIVSGQDEFVLDAHGRPRFMTDIEEIREFRDIPEFKLAPAGLVHKAGLLFEELPENNGFKPSISTDANGRAAGFKHRISKHNSLYPIRTKPDAIFDGFRMAGFPNSVLRIVENEDGYETGFVYEIVSKSILRENGATVSDFPFRALNGCDKLVRSELSRILTPT